MADHKYLKKIYIIKDCAVFRKTHEKNGGLSNMAAGYPVYFMISEGQRNDINYAIPLLDHVDTNGSNVLADR